MQSRVRMSGLTARQPCETSDDRKERGQPPRQHTGPSWFTSNRTSSRVVAIDVSDHLVQGNSRFADGLKPPAHVFHFTSRQQRTDTRRRRVWKGAPIWFVAND